MNKTSFGFIVVEPESLVFNVKKASFVLKQVPWDQVRKAIATLLFTLAPARSKQVQWDDNRISIVTGKIHRKKKSWMFNLNINGHEFRASDQDLFQLMKLGYFPKQEV